MVNVRHTDHPEPTTVGFAGDVFVRWIITAPGKSLLSLSACLGVDGRGAMLLSHEFVFRS